MKSLFMKTGLILVSLSVLITAFIVPSALAKDLVISVRGISAVEQAALQKMLSKMYSSGVQTDYPLGNVQLLDQTVLGFKVVGSLSDTRIGIRNPDGSSKVEIIEGQKLKFKLIEPSAVLSGKFNLQIVIGNKPRTLISSQLNMMGVHVVADSTLMTNEGRLQFDKFQFTEADIGRVTVEDRALWMVLFDRILKYIPLCGENCRSIDDWLTGLAKNAVADIVHNPNIEKTILETVNTELIKLARSLLNFQRFGLKAKVQIVDFKTDNDHFKIQFSVDAAPGDVVNDECRVQQTTIWEDRQRQKKTYLSDAEESSTGFLATLGIDLAKDVFAILGDQGKICIEDQAIWQRLGFRFSVRPSDVFDLWQEGRTNVWSVRLPAVGLIFPHENSAIPISSSVARSNIRLRYELVQTDRNQLLLRFKSIAMTKLYGTAKVGHLKMPLDWFRRPVMAGIYHAIQSGVSDIVLLDGTERFFDILAIDLIEPTHLAEDYLHLGFSVKVVPPATDQIR